MFRLSDNQQLFVVERFDVRDNAPLGMEDFAVLMGRSAQDRYVGSYENAAKAVNLFTRSHAELTKFYELEANSLALKMSKSKDFPSRSGVLRFARTLGVKGAEQGLETMADIAMTQLQSIDQLQQFPVLKATLEKTISHTVALNRSQLGYKGQRPDRKKRKTDSLLKPR